MSTVDLYGEVVRFHTHECPGAGFGVRVAEEAVARLGRHGPGNELVAVTETDACAADAIQVVTGCTFGKRNLVHLDNGKNVFMFWRRGEDRGIRVSAVPGSVVFRSEELWGLADRVEAAMATVEERERFSELQAQRVQQLLDANPEEILVVEEISVEAPGTKALRPSEPCEGCGEPTSVERLFLHKGQLMCPPCHLGAHGGSIPAGHAGPGHHHH